MIGYNKKNTSLLLGFCDIPAMYTKSKSNNEEISDVPTLRSILPNNWSLKVMKFKDNWDSTLKEIKKKWQLNATCGPWQDLFTVKHITWATAKTWMGKQLPGSNVAIVISWFWWLSGIWVRTCPWFSIYPLSIGVNMHHVSNVLSKSSGQKSSLYLWISYIFKIISKEKKLKGMIFFFLI